MSWSRLILLMAGCTAPSLDVGIDGIVPASGDTAVVTPIRIEGFGFDRALRSSVDDGRTSIGTTLVMLGGVRLDNVAWRTEQLIEASVPAAVTPGMYDVTVTLGSTSVVRKDGYEVLEMPPVQTWTTIETLFVPVNFGTPVSSTTTLQAGVEYHLRASGTWIIQNDAVPPTEADAEWWNFAALEDGVVGVDVGLSIDDTVVDTVKQPLWGPYNPTHVYEVSWTGSGAPIQANIYDGRYDNNDGGLTLEILASQ